MLTESRPDGSFHLCINVCVALEVLYDDVLYMWTFTLLTYYFSTSQHCIFLLLLFL